MKKGYYISNAGHVFFLSPIESKCVSDMIGNLNDKKSPGPNGIPFLIMRNVRTFFHLACKLLSGVPHVSTLGPLSFLV